MADKYIKRGTAALEEVEATVTSAGAGNAGDIVALDAAGKLSETVMPTGVAAETVVATAAEALAANDVVFINGSGVSKADASDNTKPAIGYVKAEVLQSAEATVYTDGFLPGTGFTVGARYYLSETAGSVTTTPPTTSGSIVQSIGVAVSATAIKFEPETTVLVRA